MSEFLSDDMDAITNEIATLTRQRDKLLAACKDARNRLDDPNVVASLETRVFLFNVRNMIDAAIAKAEGRGE